MGFGSHQKSNGAILNPGEVVVCLRGTGQGFHGRVFVIPEVGAKVGRMPDCAVLLNHPTVSRYHCQIELSPDGVRMRDLGSINGTWVNGIMGMESWLHQGDILRIGEVNFVVEIKSKTEFQTPNAGLPPEPQKAVTTRLMGVRERASQAIKYEDLRRERPSQRQRLSELFRGRII